MKINHVCPMLCTQFDWFVINDMVWIGTRGFWEKRKMKKNKGTWTTYDMCVDSKYGIICIYRNHSKCQSLETDKKNEERKKNIKLHYLQRAYFFFVKHFQLKIWISFSKWIYLKWLKAFEWHEGWQTRVKTYWINNIEMEIEHHMHSIRLALVQ